MTEYVLVDAQMLTPLTDRLLRCRDERRRLLALRDAVDAFEIALGVYENCMDAHCNVGGFCDHEAALLADAVQRKGIARTAVADIEVVGDDEEVKK